MNRIKLILVGVGLVAITILGLVFLEFHTVKGGYNSVKETWTDGVVDQVLQPKNYVLFPGFSQEIYDYEVTLKTYTVESYTVRSSDNQDMTITSYVQWRRDPSKLVHHHKTFKQTAETVAIKPAMIGAILRHGTQYKAIEAYSGEGLIKMQQDIAKELLENKQLKDDGIIIESYIIQENHLKAEYLEMINARQLATLRQSKAIEEQKAAEAEALVAKSKAQADLNKQVVEAQRDKEVVILKAQAEQEKQILAAKGQSQQSSIEAEGIKAKLIAEAEGKKQAMIAIAEGTLAQGKAEAEAQRLKLETYAVKGGDSFTKIEISKNMATAFSGIKGYVPQNMNITVLSDNFQKALDIGTGNTLVTTPQK